MAIVRQTLTENLSSGATGTSVVMTKPTGLADGDTLVWLYYLKKSTNLTVTYPSGFTEQFNSGATFSATFDNIYTATKPITNAAGEPASYTFSWGATGLANAGVLVRYSGVDQTTPQDAAGVTGTSSNSTTAATPAITTVTDGAMIVSIVTKPGSGQSGTSSAVTEMFDNIGEGGTIETVCIGDTEQATAGSSGTKAWTMSLKSGYELTTWALRPSTAATVTPPHPTIILQAVNRASSW